MAHKLNPRKPIYDAYEAVVKEIIDHQMYEEYAQSEIDELNNTLLQQFKMISFKLLLFKFKKLE